MGDEATAGIKAPFLPPLFLLLPQEFPPNTAQGADPNGHRPAGPTCCSRHFQHL